ncbi:hypothetical protein BT96DRAFT_845652, partial [Gymnopus androsaceus JB14]
DQPLNIEVQRKTTVELLTSRIEGIEDQGYTGVPNRKIIKEVMGSIRSRKHRTFIRKSKARNDAESRRVTKVKQKAKKGLKMNEEMGPEERADPRMEQSGIKLSTANQLLVYKAIREQRMEKYKRRNRINLSIAKAQASMKRAYKRSPTREEIWKGIRHRDLSREARYFMTMLTHDGYMIGTNWERFDKPELRERAKCRKCQMTEPSEHILTECRCNGQETIWGLAKEIWEKKGYRWRKPDLGDILTCALPKFNKNKNGEGDSRFFRILISESARLIW